jgi:predicted esterase
LSLAGCKNIPNEPALSATATIPATTPILPTSPILPTGTPPQLTPTPDLAAYAFPESIDPAQQYLFYLHGKIIEDQGLPAISPQYGEYEYEAIIKKLSGYGFVVISEIRPKNTNGIEYARKIAKQVTALLETGVPAKNITVVGASQGGGIAIYVSHFLENREINFAILAICHPDTVALFKQDQVSLYGNVLSIFDSSDNLAGSCKDLFAFSEGKGIARHEEIVLNIGTGHGILYKPLDEWVTPVIQWAGKQ